MIKLNRPSINHYPLPKSMTSETAYIIESIKIILRSIHNRRYMNEYIDKEAREMYLLVRVRAKKHYGEITKSTMMRVLADVREVLLKKPNLSFNQVFLFDWDIKGADKI
jgi:hypothetical protein